MDIRPKLAGIIKKSAGTAAEKLNIKSIPDVLIEVPKNRKLADLSTNIAMQLCKARKGLKPFPVAEDILASLKEGLDASELKGLIESVEVKPPGFINFHFSAVYFQDAVNLIEKQGPDFGKGTRPGRKNILIEFVSANPTGPLSVAHGRQAAIGDALANILQFSGHKVEREYYLNDEGNQIQILGKSIHARYCELLGEPRAFPESGYRGDYIYNIAQAVIEKHDKTYMEPARENIDFLSGFGIKFIIEGIERDLSDFNVSFDNYYSQKRLGKSGKIEKILERLKKKGLLYEKEGALWFASTEFGDDKDRVLRKSDGSYTYITPDIAYHEDKFSRGYDKLIDLWGPDHHGYIPRIKAACQAIGKDKDALSVLIVQLVTLSRAGVPVRMSTREGEFITLREVMDEVGKDVARFFFLTRRRDSHLDFDLELAKKESMDNPVYYIQYAHARICGILEHEAQEHKSTSDKGAKGDLSLLSSAEEINILRLLREFPWVIEESANNLEPNRLISFLTELAASFHLFYSRHRVVGDDAKLTSARLILVKSLKSVFSKSLELLGITCPERM